MLTRLPGVEGLRQFLEGLRRVETDEADISAAETAIEQFEKLIEELAGSQTRLAERLALSAGAAEHREVDAGLESREALFDAATRVTGRRCDVALSIYVFRPSPADPTILERALCKGMIGHHSVPGGMPMVLSSGDTIAAETDEVRLLNDRDARGRTPEAMLKPFTTWPLPTVTARGGGDTLLQVIDPAGVQDGQLVDVVTAVRGSHQMRDPQTGKPTLDAVWSLCSCPSRRLILDVYLHRDMERDYRPNLECQLWNPGLDLGDDRWVTRFPGKPKLELLGQGIASSACESYPRHAELTTYFFDRLGWNPDDYVGFRCEVTYPIWRSGYCMVFDFLR